MKYDHITHELTRNVLSGEVTDRIHLSICLDHATDCLIEDASNEEVPFYVLEARRAHIDDANDAYLNKHIGKLVDALRKFWNE